MKVFNNRKAKRAQARRAAKEAQYTQEQREYRQRRFIAPESYYFGDIEKQLKLINEAATMHNAIMQSVDGTQINPRDWMDKCINRFCKFYNIDKEKYFK